MIALSKLTGEVNAYLCAVLRGCAQLAFCDSTLAGVLVLAGITLVAPFSGLGTLVGAAFGTIVGRLVPVYRREEWAWGLASFNPAIIGLLWGGFLASSEMHLGSLIPILALSMLFDVGARRVLTRLMLPSLSTGALTTVYLVSLAAAPPGAWFWTDAPTNAVIPFGLLAAACIVAAMVMKSAFAGIWALLLSAITLVACWLANEDPRTLAGLWGITVPLACYGVHAIFLRGSLAGCIAGTMAAILGGVIWIVWQASPLSRWLPPLLLPFIVGVWLSIVVMRKLTAIPITRPSFWRVVRMLADAQAANRYVLALVRDGVGKGGYVSSFISGAWLDPQVPRSAFSRERLQTSSRCRQAFWDVCDRLRDEAKRRRADELLSRLARLQRDGWLWGVMIQDVMMSAQMVRLGGVVPLHGDVERTQCLDCGTQRPWPPMAVWRRCDLRCPGCEGPVVPAVTLFGGTIDDATLSRLRELETRCALVLVLGEEASEPATLAFLEHARRAGASVVFISDGTPSYRRGDTDLSVSAPVDRFLALLQLVLHGWWLFRGHRSIALPVAHASLASKGGVPPDD